MASGNLDGEIRQIRPEDLEQAFVLETEGYPADEAASYEQLICRQRAAPSLFLGYFEGKDLIGFIVGTRYFGPRFHYQSMAKHEPTGEVACIHSVCVEASRRRQGIALKLLAAFHKQVEHTQQGVTSLMLLSKSQLIPLYTRAGFIFVNKFEEQHGKDQWYEMELVL